MRKILAMLLATTVILSLSALLALAHPKAIEEKTFELQADTIFVKETTTVGESYTVEYTNPQQSDDDVYSIYPFEHPRESGGFAVLRVDVSSVKQASDFALNFSFITRGVKNDVFSIYCADYETGKSLFESLTPGTTQTVTLRPAVYLKSIISENLIYKFTTKNTYAENLDVVLSCNDSSTSNPYIYGSVLKEHIEAAINGGEDSVYFVVKVTGSKFFYLYNSASNDKAPSLTVTGSTISSEVVKNEDGYTYKVGGLNNYADRVVAIVAACDSKDNIISVATSTMAETTPGDTVDTEIACPGAAKLMAYILKAGTLVPLTYVENVLLGD